MADSSPSASAPRITVVVISHNAEEVIEECLDAVCAFRGVEFDLLVIDNASTDSTRELVRERYPEAELLPLAENGGPNPARNLGLRHSEHRYVLLVDDDVVLPPDSAARLLAAITRAPNAALTTGRTVYYRRPDTVQYAGMLPHYLGEGTTLSGDRKLAECPDEVRTVPICVSTFMLVDREKAAYVGDFDESYVFGKDDMDFTLRLTLAGFDILELPDVVARHRVKPRGFKNAARQIRNRWYYMLKNYSVRTLVLIAPALVVDELLRIAFLAGSGAFGAYLRGTVAAVRDVPLALRERRHVQRLRRRRDSEFLTAGEVLMRRDLVRYPALHRVKAWYDRATTGYWKLVQRFV